MSDLTKEAQRAPSSAHSVRPQEKTLPVVSVTAAREDKGRNDYGFSQEPG